MRKPGSAVQLPQRVRNVYWQARERVAPWLPTVLLGVVIVVPLALFAWLVFATDAFVIQAVTVVDAREDIAREAQGIVEEGLVHAHISDNIFFVPTERLEGRILHDVPTIRNVHIVRKLPSTLKIIIQEKEPAFVLLSKGTYYFVDEQGIAYERARLENLPGITLSTVKNDDMGGEVTLGAAAVEPTFVAFIARIEELLPDAVGAHIAEIHIPSLSAREAHFTLDTNWKILLDATRDANRQVAILQEVLQSTLSAEERTALEYIDLRVPQRVYYRTTLPVQESREQEPVTRSADPSPTPEQ